MSIYIISNAFFLVLTLLLVGLLLLVESKVVVKGTYRIRINNDDDSDIKASAGATLLSSLADNGIYIPSACGGGGTCGTCKCRVEGGQNGLLPTEKAHLSVAEQKADFRLACQFKVKTDVAVHLPQDIFNVKKFEATVVSNENIATFIKELTLALDPGEALEFNAGAYIQIDIPEYELSFSQFRKRVSERFRPAWDRFNFWKLRSKNEEPVFRAYSLANPPYEKDRLSFTIRIATPPDGQSDLPPGTGSSYIFNLQPGDRVTLSGPYGEFLVKDTDREMCFIGGAGMAPLRSQIFHQLNALKTRRRMSFWYGARSKQELFYDNDFRALEREHPNFTFHVSLSNPGPEDHWTGQTGYIHHYLHDAYLVDHEDPTEIEYYLCGPPPMIDAVVTMLDDLGVEPEMILFDMF